MLFSIYGFKMDYNTIKDCNLLTISVYDKNLRFLSR